MAVYWKGWNIWYGNCWKGLEGWGEWNGIVGAQVEVCGGIDAAEPAVTVDVNGATKADVEEDCTACEIGVDEEDEEDEEAEGGDD